VHKVKERLTSGTVTDAKGDEYEARLVYPVPKSSRSVEVPELSRRGSAASTASKQARLEQYRAPIAAQAEAVGRQGEDLDAGQVHARGPWNGYSRHPHPKPQD
jgi:hypothetical protein